MNGFIEDESRDIEKNRADSAYYACMSRLLPSRFRRTTCSELVAYFFTQYLSVPLTWNQHALLILRPP